MVRNTVPVRIKQITGLINVQGPTAVHHAGRLCVRSGDDIIVYIIQINRFTGSAVTNATAGIVNYIVAEIQAEGWIRIVGARTQIGAIGVGPTVVVPGVIGIEAVGNDAAKTMSSRSEPEPESYRFVTK